MRAERRRRRRGHHLGEATRRRDVARLPQIAHLPQSCARVLSSKEDARSSDSLPWSQTRRVRRRAARLGPRQGRGRGDRNLVFACDRNLVFFAFARSVQSARTFRFGKGRLESLLRRTLRRAPSEEPLSGWLVVYASRHFQAATLEADGWRFAAVLFFVCFYFVMSVEREWADLERGRLRSDRARGVGENTSPKTARPPPPPSCEVASSLSRARAAKRETPGVLPRAAAPARGRAAPTCDSEMPRANLPRPRPAAATRGRADLISF